MNNKWKRNSYWKLYQDDEQLLQDPDSNPKAEIVDIPTPSIINSKTSNTFLDPYENENEPIPAPPFTHDSSVHSSTDDSTY